MPWTLILNWRVIFAVLVSITLATSHWKAYVAGKHSTLAHIQAEALANEQAARAREQALVAAKHKAEEDHAAFKLRTQRAVAGAQSELVRLRDTLANRQTAATATTCTGTDAAATTERQLFGQCAEALAGVAQQADQLAAQVTGLQGYVSAVCLKPQ
jgi:Tfp pilus assembly protein PilV